MSAAKQCVLKTQRIILLCNIKMLNECLILHVTTQSILNRCLILLKHFPKISATFYLTYNLSHNHKLHSGKAAARVQFVLS